jgi:hypothetical protein
MTKYAVGVVAKCRSHTAHALFFVEAVSREEAEGKGLRIARKTYPPLKGWYDHTVLSLPTEIGPLAEETAREMEGP